MTIAAVRLLFSFAGGNGHLQPLVPFASAACAAGHAVAVAGRSAMADAVGAAGFAFFATGGDAPASSPPRVPLTPVDRAREDRVLRDGFAGSLARERAARMVALCAAWRPDLVVCDETDFGAMVAAERTGIPHASVLVIASGTFVRHELVVEPLSRLRADHGLPADPVLAMLDRCLVLSPFPPSLRDPALGRCATLHAVRPAALERPAGGVPSAWRRPAGSRPLVYLTLGTVFNVESGDLFTRLIEGVRELPVDLVVTVGHQIDPAELGPQPANVQVARYVAQELILPACDAVVSHGGSGSVVGALAHGKPLVLVPMGADQSLNGDRCRQLGVGRTLDPIVVTPDGARAAVSAVLADPAYRRAAEGPAQPSARACSSAMYRSLPAM